MLVLLWGARGLARWLFRNRRRERTAFWIRQELNLAAAILLFFGVVSIWFDDPTRLTTAVGLVTAGLAFALQKVVTALAGYVVILRGKTFNVGDRIVMGGVRGDVIALDFTQTSIMEMGQAPPVQRDEPAMWVQSRQYTGRIVTVSKDAMSRDLLQDLAAAGIAIASQTLEVSGTLGRPGTEPAGRARID